MKNLCEAWEKHGVAAIEKVAKDDPTSFVRVVASLLPKDITGKDSQPLEIVFINGDENL